MPARLAVPAAAFLLTGAALAALQAAVAQPMLLAERFVPGAGWVEAAALATWAAVLARKMLDPRQSGKWRRRAWTLFSAAFFGQLLLGLAGVSRCLMTGDLHLPVPALIVAGPIWRGGEGLFMPILFLSTVVLVGPAWCSHLCYVGAWDSLLIGSWNRHECASYHPYWRTSKKLTEVRRRPSSIGCFAVGSGWSEFSRRRAMARGPRRDGRGACFEADLPRSAPRGRRGDRRCVDGDVSRRRPARR